MADKWEERGKKMQDAGKNVQRMGCLLTALITLPIIGLIAFSIPGLIIGALIGGVIFWAVQKQAKEKEGKEL